MRAIFSPMADVQYSDTVCAWCVEKKNVCAWRLIISLFGIRLPRAVQVDAYQSINLNFKIVYFTAHMPPLPLVVQMYPCHVITSCLETQDIYKEK